MHTGMPVVIICKFTIWTTLTRSDTANSYQKEESEIWIGEWLAKRGMLCLNPLASLSLYAKIAGVRDDVVIATKYTANVHDQQVEKYPNQINRSGNSVKSMMVSLEASLKKLGTTYIDVFCECPIYERRDADD